MKPLLFTYGLTFGGALCSLWNPFVGFLIYVSFAIIKPDTLWEWAVPEGNYSRIVAIALLVGWAVRGGGDWQWGRARGIIVAMLGYWLVLAIGVATAPDQGRAWGVLEPMSKTFLPILVGITLIDSIAKLRQLLWVIVLAQGYLAYEFNLRYYFAPRAFVSWEFWHGGLDNNGIAITMVTSIGLAFFLGMTVRTWWQQGLVFGLAGLMAHVVLFSNSRGGMTALIITGVVSFFLLPKQPKHYLIFALAVLLVARLAGAGVQERFMSSFAAKEQDSNADVGGKRRAHWAACIESMAKRPLGVGPNHWPITAPQYGLPEMAAHSTWFQIGAELGFPGLICLGSFYGLCIRRLWPLTRQRYAVPDPWMRSLARMVIASLVGFIVSAQFVTIDGIELPYYVALLGAGTLKVLSTAPVQASDHGDDQEEPELAMAAASRSNSALHGSGDNEEF